MRLLPLALEHLRQTHPQVRVCVEYGLNERLMPMVRHGEIACALSSIPSSAAHPDLRHQTLHLDRAVVIARSDHPLAARRKVVPADLARYPWVLARRWELERKALDELFADAGVPPVRAAVETSSAILMKTLVMQGDFLSFVPLEMIHWEHKAGLLRPLGGIGSSWERHVGITTRRDAAANDGMAALTEGLVRAAGTLRARGAHAAPRSRRTPVSRHATARSKPQDGDTRRPRLQMAQRQSRGTSMCLGHESHHMSRLPARRVLQLATLVLAAATLSACYVVPMQPGPAAVVVPAGAPAPALPLGMSARLYPANELATPYGMVSATVSNDLNGRGHFLAQIAGESFTGEATRVAGSQREGVANGTGSRGSFLACRYTMNSPTLGTGQCRMSNGAQFSMHVGG
jgi:hypothetical protein